MYIAKILLFVLTLLSVPVAAAPVSLSVETNEELAFDAVAINKTLDNLTEKLNTNKVSRDETDDYMDTLTELQTQTQNAQKQIAAELSNISKKISALNSSSVEGEEDLPEIIKERAKYEAKAGKYKSQQAQSALILTKIDEINNLILKKRNQDLINDILAKQSSIFQPEEFWQSLLSFGGFLKGILVSPLNWYQQLKPEQQDNARRSLGILSIMIGAAFVVAVLIRQYLRKNFGYNLDINAPTYGQKFRAAVWIFIANGAIPAAIITAFWTWINNYELMAGSDFAILLKNFAIYLLYFLIFRAGVLAAFAPRNPDWRIFNIDAKKVRRASNALITAAAMITAVSFFQRLATEMSHQPEIIYSMQIFANAIKAFAVIWVAFRVLYDVKDLSEEEVESENIQKLSVSSQAALAIILFMTIAFGFSLFGYISFSAYLINRFIVSVAVISALYIAYNLLLMLYHNIIRWRFWITAFRINRRTLIKSEVWFGIILTPIVYIFGALVLLAVWGVSVDILIAKTKGVLTGFNIGEVHVSITSLLLGIIAFWVAMLLVKMLKSSIQQGALSKLDFDDGMKNSIISGVGFFGFIFSVILGIAVAGGSFKSLAIMAGALSFGAGLGLQNIVSNLVAGITILFERPIKLGDVVIINGYEGTVKQISMRSTILEMGNKSNVIIPNSAIISGSVVNKTHDNRMSRIEIKVGVDYDSDIAKVRDILLSIAQNDSGVLKTPAPVLTFTDFGDSSLDFQLNCYISNVSKTAEVTFRLRENIINAFREAGIDIPFPQRVVRPLVDGVTEGNLGETLTD
ncbi:MAG: mechanosensitive ion channel [Acetobacter sp.]|nr:mechanosensitive ion channel [Acetobacter sp.]